MATKPARNSPSGIEEGRVAGRGADLTAFGCGTGLDAGRVTAAPPPAALFGLDVPGPDVPGPDLPGPDLSGPDLPGPDFPAPDLPGPDLPNPDLANPDLPNPDLPGSDLPGPDLPGPDLPGPDLLPALWLADLPTPVGGERSPARSEDGAGRDGPRDEEGRPGPLDEDFDVR